MQPAAYYLGLVRIFMKLKKALWILQPAAYYSHFRRLPRWHFEPESIVLSGVNCTLLTYTRRG